MENNTSIAQSFETTFHGQKYSALREGEADILTISSTKPPTDKTERASVFYNPVQRYNRDLSVLAIRAFGEDYAYVKEEKRLRQQSNAGEQKGRKRKREGNTHKESSSTEPSEDSKEVIDPAKDTNGHAAAPPEESSALEPTPAADMHKTSNERSEGKQDGSTNKPKHDDETPFRILDALSATGLRALRYAKEIPMATQIVANDVSVAATDAIRRNAEFNNVQDKIQVSTADAVDYMSHAKSRCRDRYTSVSGLYQVVDLDPYGTVAPFIDSAIRALADGGLLCVTSTDSRIFASNGYPEKTFSQYGGLPLEGPCAHEGGLRLIIQSIATAAARHGLAIEPLLSLSVDFYARLFIRIRRSPADVKFLALKTMYVHNCHHGCGAWSLQHQAHADATTDKGGSTLYRFKAAQSSGSSQCEHCGFKTHLAGPMWSGPLHNPHFIKKILSTIPKLDPQVYQSFSRIEGMLSLARDECVDIPRLRRNSRTRGFSPSKSSDTKSDCDPKIDSAARAGSARPVPPVPPHIRTLHPFFLYPPSIAKILRTETPSDAQLRGALLHLGYRATRSHTKAGSISTDAPWSVVWRIMRAWVAQHAPIKDGALKEGTAGWAIMNQTPQTPHVAESTESQAGDGEHKDLSESTIDGRPVTNANKGTPLELLNDTRANIDALSKADLPDEVRQIVTSLHRPVNALMELLRLAGPDKMDRQELRGLKNLPTIHGTADNDRKGDNQELANGDKQPEIVFDEQLGRRGRGTGKVFYAVNPPNWGPKRKATGSRVVPE